MTFSGSLSSCAPVSGDWLPSALCIGGSLACWEASLRAARLCLIFFHHASGPGVLRVFVQKWAVGQRMNVCHNNHTCPCHSQRMTVCYVSIFGSECYSIHSKWRREKHWSNPSAQPRWLSASCLWHPSLSNSCLSHTAGIRLPKAIWGAFLDFGPTFNQFNFFCIAQAMSQRASQLPTDQHLLHPIKQTEICLVLAGSLMAEWLGNRAIN